MTRTDFWPPARVAALKRLHDEGLGDREIAARLNATFGTQLTKSAIIGCRHRLGLFRLKRAPERLQNRISAHSKQPRESKKKAVLVPPAARSRSRKAAKQQTPAKPNVPVAPQPAFGFATVPIPLEMLERRHCRWPMNDGGPYLFCALNADEHSYCDHHRAIAWRAR